MATSKTAGCFQLGVRFPDGSLQTTAATGGSSPGGSNGNVQGNNSGAFGGMPGSVIDFTNGLLSIAPTGTGVALSIFDDGGGTNDIADFWDIVGGYPVVSIGQPASGNAALTISSDSSGADALDLFINAFSAVALNINKYGNALITPPIAITGSIPTYSAALSIVAAPANTLHILDIFNNGQGLPGISIAKDPSDARGGFVQGNCTSGRSFELSGGRMQVTGTGTTDLLDLNVGGIPVSVFFVDASGNLHLNVGLYDGTGSLGTSGQVLSTTGTTTKWATASSGSGTVTSVGLSTPSIFSVSGSPVTSSGTLTIALATQSANLVWASPSSGVAATPTFRSLVVADFPTSGSWAFAGTLSGNLTISGTTLHTAATTFGLASYTSGISNSTTAVLAGSYESSAVGPTYAEDSWTITDTIGTGVNGSSYLTFVHSGTTGPASLAVGAMSSSVGTSAPIVTGGIAFSGTLATGASSLASFGAISANTFAFYPSSSTSVNQTLALNFYTNAATTNNQNSWNLSCTANNGLNASLSISAQLNTNGQSMLLACAMGTSTIAPGIVLGGNGGNNTKDFSATSGTQTAVSVGGITGTGRVQFTPASGTANFVGLQVVPIINQTSTASGSYTGLLINITETAVLGTANNLIDLQIGGVSKVSITNKGHIQAGAVGGSANTDLAGQATITASSTTVSVSFSSNYKGTAQPSVVITPTSDPIVAGVPVGTWVTYSGSAGAWTGFTINISATLAANVTFNYHVIGNP